MKQFKFSSIENVMASRLISAGNCIVFIYYIILYYRMLVCMGIRFDDAML